MKILYLSSEVPYPPVSGGRVRSLAELELLSSLDEVSAITVLTLTEDAPDAKAIAVIDPATRQATNWPMQAGGNFPMALRPESQHVLVVFRRPARLGVFAMADGASV